ncbi:MAG: pyridoxamine 5'-phosphate oxidase family protein [Solirubrobacteraceae bacterium]
MLALDRDECLRLLAAHHFGRLIAVSNGRPLIRPVNYAFDPVSQSVVFRTDGGTKFRALLGATQGAFEVDGFDERLGIGWSVIIHGVVAEVHGPGDIARLEQLPIRRCAPGPMQHWMRIRAWTVSGRRLVRPRGPVPAQYLG